jgi:putative endonuclease
MTRRLLGERGEIAAADYLDRAGWSILHRNYRVGHKEIDLIAARDGVVAFVEVKTRRAEEFGHPFEFITERKRSAIRSVAHAWIAEYGLPQFSYRFDAISVTPDGQGGLFVDHLEDAWGI